MKWLYGLIAVAAVAALLALTLQSARMNTAAPQQALRYDHMLSCAECAAAGQVAYIWRSPEMQQPQCRAVWGADVAIISKRGDLVEVEARDWCRGWVAASLIKPT